MTVLGQCLGQWIPWVECLKHETPTWKAQSTVSRVNDMRDWVLYVYQLINTVNMSGLSEYFWIRCIAFHCTSPEGSSLWLKQSFLCDSSRAGKSTVVYMAQALLLQHIEGVSFREKRVILRLAACKDLCVRFLNKNLLQMSQRDPAGFMSPLLARCSPGAERGKQIILNCKWGRKLFSMHSLSKQTKQPFAKAGPSILNLRQ